MLSRLLQSSQSAYGARPVIWCDVILNNANRHGGILHDRYVFGYYRAQHPMIIWEQ